MKIKCRFVLLHDSDNDPLIINVDKINRLENTEELAKVVFKDGFSYTKISEGVTRAHGFISNTPVTEVEEFLLLHDKNNDHISINVCDILDVYSLPKNYSNGRSKIYYSESEAVYVKEGVNKIYELLGNVKENVTVKG